MRESSPTFCPPPKKKDYGADLGKYKWWQTEDEVTVTVPFPVGVKGKDVTCKMDIHHILIGLKGEAPIIDGDLFAAIKLDDSTWTYGKKKA